MRRSAGTAQDAIDWSAVTEEALDRLCTYVRFPTVNDPDSATGREPWRAGREAEATAWLAGLLRTEGIPHEVLEAAPGRTSLLVRLDAPQPAPSITLLSHSDVVPAIRAEWDVDPFAGTVRGGHLYGRGVLDLKGLSIAQLTTLILLHRHQVPLRRGVVLLVAADEETGGAYGARWAVRERPELLDTSLLLGEGGFSPTGVLPDAAALHAVAVAEKGYLELELTAEGCPHHASMPDPDCAPARLVRALNRVLDLPVEIRLTPPTERLCVCLAEGASGFHRLMLRHPRLLRWLGARGLPSSPLIRSMFTETCGLTVLDSGYKSNVVPGSARAVLSIRLLPGTGNEDAIERVRGAVADPVVQVRTVMSKPATSSPFDTADFQVLARCVAAEGDRTRISPILSPAASDARHWRAAGVPCYGWVPFVLPVEDIHGVHGPNERIATDAFAAGLRLYHQAVTELVTVPARPHAPEEQ